MLGLLGCKSIESLLAMISQLQHLTMLWLKACENLKGFLQGIASLSSLSLLGLSSYKSIQSLPTLIGQLQHLTELWLIKCEILSNFLKALQASLHYQCWAYLVVSPLNHQ
jgi:hypothetical protein